MIKTHGESCNAAGAAEVVGPVAAEAAIAYGGAGFLSVEELISSGVDAYMGHAAAVGSFKEHQISRLKLTAVYIVSHAILGRCGAGGGIAHLGQNVVHKPGAVKAIRGCTAVDIGSVSV